MKISCVLQGLSTILLLPRIAADFLKTNSEIQAGVVSVLNGGSSCWSSCNQVSGPCDFCGRQGACCRKGSLGDHPSCQTVKFWASATEHICVAAKHPDEEDPILFVGVYTAPTEVARERRIEIRQTYWRDKLLKRNGGPIEARFIVGRADEGGDAQNMLEKELAAHPEDFLQLPVHEGYTNLTAKTLAFLRWFSLNSRARFVLKMDDDTFPHFNAITPVLEATTAKYAHLGLLFPCAPVLKQTKWAENPLVWNHSFFPKYMQGSGYFLSAPLAQELSVRRHDQNRARMLNNEDAAVGLWIEMERWDSPSFDVDQRHVSSTLSGCAPKDLVSMNNMPGYMRCYWARKMRGEEDVCCYGPLSNLRQSLLQTKARVQARAHTEAATRCYGGVFVN
eukprot:CAMPEP_0170625388 /NCGR_PEP_ID=MMETSP0224-20130122/30730_1 /TAXON_ID=285029 /ORGANISM="Togula jolla, Strain CCCM 725" /LENGTH=391 /DNA_ID=CAMNT_0010951955 /DNA_START=107 /DNA_END=1282 /DNA_ORIENTATION=-